MVTEYPALGATVPFQKHPQVALETGIRDARGVHAHHLDPIARGQAGDRAEHRHPPFAAAWHGLNATNIALAMPSRCCCLPAAIPRRDGRRASEQRDGLAAFQRPTVGACCCLGALGGVPATFRDVAQALDEPSTISPDANASGGTVVPQQARDGYLLLDDRSRVEPGPTRSYVYRYRGGSIS